MNNVIPIGKIKKDDYYFTLTEKDFPAELWKKVQDGMDNAITVTYEACLFDSFDPAKNPVMGLACPCPKCSARC